MKVSVTGSRSITDYEWFKKKLNLILKSVQAVNTDNSELTFISGGAKGIDSFIKTYCIENNFSIEEIKPDWNKYGKSAGVLRNKEIIEQSDINLIFWDGISKGSKFNINYCKNNNKNFRVIIYEKI